VGVGVVGLISRDNGSGVGGGVVDVVMGAGLHDSPVAAGCRAVTTIPTLHRAPVTIVVAIVVATVSDFSSSSGSGRFSSGIMTMAMYLAKSLQGQGAMR
jgi:hypothetical protein